MKKKQNNKQRPANDLPPVAFCEWWNPTGRDEISGADIGGHPDAERVWARKEPGRWHRRTYGTNANLAWLCEPYYQEYTRWVEAGKPKAEPFVSLAASMERVKQFWHGLASELSAIVKPVPKLEEMSPKERQRQKVQVLNAKPVAGKVIENDDIDFTHRSYNDE